MDDLPTLGLLINGKERIADDATIVTNTSTKLKKSYVRYVSATTKDAEDAATASEKAFETWSKTLPRDRRDILMRTARLVREHSDELCKIQMEETNCSELWATTNIRWAAQHLEEMAGRITTVLQGEIPVVQTPGQTALVFKRPVGPVLSIPPWNAGLFLATRALDTPVAVGCTVVLKASEQSPRLHHYLVSLFTMGGLPPGVINIVQARREDSAAVTEALVAHRAIRKIEFIGSAGVGARIGALAGQHLKPVLMELGGKAAIVVMDDADLELAAQGTVHGGFMHSGQICLSAERIIVHSSIIDKFLPILFEKAKNYPIYEAISSVGPGKTIKMLEDAIIKGAKVLYGDVKLIEPQTLQPIIISGVTPDMELYDEESFGPVMAVYVVASDEEAVRLTNSSRYGLAAAIYSNNVTRALGVASKIEVGQLHINWPMGTTNDEATVGVGISKRSGWGAQNGAHGLEEFLDVRTVTITNPAAFAAAMQAAGR